MSVISRRTNPNELFVSVRGVLWAEVREHLVQEFDAVVDRLQRALLLFHLLCSELVLEDTNTPLQTQTVN